LPGSPAVVGVGLAVGSVVGVAVGSTVAVADGVGSGEALGAADPVTVVSMLGDADGGGELALHAARRTAMPPASSARRSPGRRRSVM
jgi:hypothetical protein